MSGMQNTPIKGREYKMKSGKYHKYTLEEILNVDPAYIVMMAEKHYLVIQFDIINEAKEKVKNGSVTNSKRVRSQNNK